MAEAPHVGEPWGRCVMPVMMQWDYGDQQRGRSTDDIFLVENMQGVAERVVPVWIDDVLSDSRAFELRVRDAVERERPDLVFFAPYQEEASPELLGWLRDSGIPTVAWFSDDDWRFDSYTRHRAPLYSHVVTTAFLMVDRYRDELGIDPLLVRWGGQLRGAIMPPVEDESEYELDIAFIGQTNPYRRWFLDRLRANGLQVEAFGWGTDNGRISFEEMERIYRVSRINLNIANSADPDIRYALRSPRNLIDFVRSPKRGEQMKGRNCEIPLAGGFQLTNYVPGLEQYFVVGDEVAAYSSVDDCIDLLRYYLRHPELRVPIARAGHRRAAAEHTYEHRVREVFHFVWGPPDAAPPPAP